MTLFALALWGCGSADLRNIDGEEDKPLDPTAPSALSIDVPSAAAWLPAGSTQVSGRAVNVAGASLNGSPVDVSNGAFQATASLQPGLNSFVLTGEGADGRAHKVLRSSLSGSYAPASGAVPGALQLHVGADVLAGAGSLANGLLVADDLVDSVLAGNPLIDDGDMTVNAVGLAWDDAIVELLPTDGVLEVAIHLPNFQVPLEVRTWALFFPITVDAALTAQDIVVTTGIVLGVDGNGGLRLDLAQPEVEIQGFAIEVGGLAGLFAGGAIDEVEAELMLRGQLEALLGDLPSMADGLLADLDLGMQTELMGLNVAIAPRFSSAAVHSSGLALGVDVAMDVDGASITGPGHLTVGAPPAATGDGVQVQLADDFMNRLLIELWGGGALDLSLPIAPGGLESTLLTMFGGQPGVGGSLSLVSSLPPVWIGRDGDARLQLGEVLFTVETPGGQFGDRVELAMAVDARAALQLGADAFGIQLSAAQIKLAPVGASAEVDALVENLPNLETAMGIGIGMLNDMLSFPLAAEGAEPVALPPIAFQRDVSGKGTHLALSLEEIGGLIAALTAEPGVPSDPSNPSTDPADPTSGPSTPNVPAASGDLVVGIPSDTPVYSSNATVNDDGAAGWICRNDRVTANGDAGTWYMDDRAEIRVYGTGHVIYAMDNADVRLYTGDNVIYADPGAEIDDRSTSGTNTVYWLDSVGFDLSQAPTPGC